MSNKMLPWGQYTYLLLYDQIIMFANICYKQQQLKIQHCTIFIFPQVLMYKMGSCWDQNSQILYWVVLLVNWQKKECAKQFLTLTSFSGHMKHPNKSKQVTSAIK